MNSEQFRLYGKQMVDLIADYLENCENRNVISEVKPGYLKNLIPNDAPYKSDTWQDLINDIESKIMPGITHWSSPYFFGYFASGNSFASHCANILINGISCNGSHWVF